MFHLFYYYLVCEAVGTAATPALLCQPLVIMKMIVEKQMECRLAGETEILGENLPQRHIFPSQYPMFHLTSFVTSWVSQSNKSTDLTQAFNTSFCLCIPNHKGGLPDFSQFGISSSCLLGSPANIWCRSSIFRYCASQTAEICYSFYPCILYCYRLDSLQCKSLSLLHIVQTGSGVHPSSYPSSTGGFFPDVKQQGRGTDHSPTASADVKRMELYLHSPHMSLWSN
jgi:hypothetical protein